MLVLVVPVVPDFNSTIVRLKLEIAETKKELQEDFNSTIVRLKLQREVSKMSYLRISILQ